jgi:hypothetical protein
MAEKMNRHLSGYSDDELRTVLDFMRAGRTAADEEIARIREQGTRHATHRPPVQSTCRGTRPRPFGKNHLPRTGGVPRLRPG